MYVLAHIFILQAKKCYYHAKIFAKLLLITRIIVPLHQIYKF